MNTQTQEAKSMQDLTSTRIDKVYTSTLSFVTGEKVLKELDNRTLVDTIHSGRWSDAYGAVIIEVQIGKHQTFKDYQWAIDYIVEAGFDVDDLESREAGKQRTFAFKSSYGKLELRLDATQSNHCVYVKTGSHQVDDYKLVCHEEVSE